MELSDVKFSSQQNYLNFPVLNYSQRTKTLNRSSSSSFLERNYTKYNQEYQNKRRMSTRIRVILPVFTVILFLTQKRVRTETEIANGILFSLRPANPGALPSARHHNQQAGDNERYQAIDAGQHRPGPDEEPPRHDTAQDRAGL